MKPLTITNKKKSISEIQLEIKRTKDARYHHRLHAILLVADGMTCQKVAELSGDSLRIVQYWVRHFEKGGMAGLKELEKTGRPTRISQEQLDEIATLISKKPIDLGLSGHQWNGIILSEFFKKKWNLDLSVRQCQRILKSLKRKADTSLGI